MTMTSRPGKLDLIQPVFSHEESTCTLRTHKPFMSTRAIAVTAQCFKIRGYAAWTLSSIKVEQDIPGSQRLTQFGTLLGHQTTTVVARHMTKTHHPSIRREYALDFG